ATERRDNTMQGTVKWFDAEKGFGFIAVEGGGQDVFVHFSAITDPSYRLEANQRVEFDIKQSPQGLEAANVRVINGATGPTTATTSTPPRWRSGTTRWPRSAT